MDILNQLLDSTSIPVVAAFIIGLLASISPCPLATNISAIAYISKEISDSKKIVLNGVYYTLGRIFSYSVLCLLINFGVSSFSIASIFQKWGDKVLGPILIVLGLIMLDVIKLHFKSQNNPLTNISERLAKKGYFGSFLLGAMFALAFCPYSGILFFGLLIPLMANSTIALLLAPVFGLATGLPVILFSLILTFSVNKFAQAFKLTQKLELFMRKAIAIVLLLTGIYYLKFLIRYIITTLF